MQKHATLKNENPQPAKGLHQKHYELSEPHKGYRHVLVTRVNRSIPRPDIIIGFRIFKVPDLELQHTLIQASNEHGDNLAVTLERHEYGITAKEALNRHGYHPTN